jgi:hypothetical protein
MLFVPTNDLHVVNDSLFFVYFDALEIIEHSLHDAWMYEEQSDDQCCYRTAKVVSLVLLIFSVDEFQ